jgi:hypothetical protein
MKKRFCVFAAVLGFMLVLGLAGCKQDSPSGPLDGTWQGNLGDTVILSGYSWTYKNGSGGGTFDFDSSANTGNIYQGNTKFATFVVSGNTLTATWGGSVQIFTRQ